MKLSQLSEPPLEFGGAGHHVDIRFGLMNYGPLDATSPLAPKKIRLGLVGTPRDLELLREWLVRCQSEIPARRSRRPNLFPRFPGFREDRAFCSTLVLDSTLEQVVSDADIEQMSREPNSNTFISATVDSFVRSLKHLRDTAPVDIIVCAVPEPVEEMMDPAKRSIPLSEGHLDFHDLLKARAMDLAMPIQLAL